MTGLGQEWTITHERVLPNVVGETPVLAAWTAWGHLLAVSFSGGVVAVFSANPGDEVKGLQFPMAPTSLCWDAGGGVLGIALVDERVFTWTGSVPKLHAGPGSHWPGGSVMAARSRGRLFAWGASDGRVSLSTLATGGFRHNAREATGCRIAGLAWCPRGTRLALHDADGMSPEVSQVEAGAPLRWQRLAGGSSPLTCVWWHPSGDWLFAGTVDGCVLRWDGDLRAPPGLHRLSVLPIRALGGTDDGRVCVAGVAGTSPYVIVFDPAGQVLSDQPLRRAAERPFLSQGVVVAVRPGNYAMAAADAHGDLSLWRLAPPLGGLASPATAWHRLALLHTAAVSGRANGIAGLLERWFVVDRYAAGRFDGSDVVRADMERRLNEATAIVFLGWHDVGLSSYTMAELEAATEARRPILWIGPIPKSLDLGEWPEVVHVPASGAEEELHDLVAIVRRYIAAVPASPPTERIRLRHVIDTAPGPKGWTVPSVSATRGPAGEEAQLRQAVDGYVSARLGDERWTLDQSEYRIDRRLPWRQISATASKAFTNAMGKNIGDAAMEYLRNNDIDHTLHGLQERASALGIPASELFGWIADAAARE